MHVWVDQDLCTGDGLCEEIAPNLFRLADDGLCYVVGNDGLLLYEGGSSALAPVAGRDEDAVREAAEECPGECIFIVERPEKDCGGDAA